jgi:hypothetical protein
MDDISSSRIHEDTIIFSTRKINAYNTTIQRGSIIILGGDREILRDVLNYKQSTKIRNEGRTQSNFALVSTPTPPDEDFYHVQANEVKVPTSTNHLQYIWTSTLIYRELWLHLKEHMKCRETEPRIQKCMTLTADPPVLFSEIVVCRLL